MTREAVEIVPVRTASRSYDVSIGPALLGALGEIVRKTLGDAPKRAAVIADKNIPSELMSRVDISLSRAGFFVARIGIEATEDKKSLVALEGILAFLASTKLERTEPVIAIGGGIVGDLAGFAAATHRRGCPVIQCPTTLLSMVDASVGGKTGVNLSIHAGGGKSLLKNAVGAFHQPHAVVASLDTLDSLSPRQFNAGLAECVKHALLGGQFGEPALLEWMEKRASEQTQGSEKREGQGWSNDTLRELVTRNVALKTKVVAGDEREEAPSASGGRALLNLGHTFAHAIETLPGLAFTTCEGESTGPLLHGEAVAIGLVAACHAAASLTLCEATLPQRVATLLARFGLPTASKGLPPTDAILARMAHDKKVASGTPRLVLPTNNRHAVVTESPPKEAIIRAIDAMRS